MIKANLIPFGILLRLISSAGRSCLGQKIEEPIYAGKGLSVWLQEIDGTKSFQDVRAREAIRNLGTNALPYLTNLLRAPDSELKQNQVSARTDDLSKKPQAKRIAQMSGKAALACAAIGEPAVPSLLELVGVDETYFLALGTIVTMGAKAVPALVEGLNHRDEEMRARIVYIISCFRSDAEVAIPAIIKRLRDDSPRVRGVAATALGTICKKPDLAIPALIESLKDPLPEVRTSVIWVIKDFDQDGRAAIPALRKATKDSNPNVREAAIGTLELLKAPTVP